MLFYLQIQADSYANLVQYFYEPAKARIIPGGFRGQLIWFAKPKHSQFDPEYSSILRANRIAGQIRARRKS